MNNLTKGSTIFLAMLLVLTLLPFVTAEMQHLPTQKQYSCFEIQQTCSNCTYVTLEYITYPAPNSTVAYINTNMTQQGNGYNYTFCETDTTGVYIISTCGDVDGILTCVNYDLEVTSTGDSSSNTFFIIFLILSFALLLVAFIFKNTVFAFFSGLFFLVSGVYTMINGFANITSTYTYIIAIVLIGVGAILSITSALDFMDENYGGDDSSVEED
jgi:hypothetical protein